MLVEHRQRDVGQQRRQDASLRRAGVGVLEVAEFGEDPGFEERLDQPQHSLVLDPQPDTVHQGRVVDRVEARLDVRVQHPPITLGAEQMDLGDRVVCAPLGPEPVGDRLKVGLEDGFQHQFQRRLDNPVGHRRDPEAADLSRPARFGDLAFPHRLRSELPALDQGAEVVQERGASHLLLDPGDGPPVRTGGVGPAVCRDPVPRHDQRGRVVHEVEQVVEPATRIGHRPTVKLGLHLRYPPPRTHRHWVDDGSSLGLGRHHSVPHLSALQPPIPSRYHFSKPLPSFAM